MLLTRRTVHPRGYASDLHSLRPCLGQGASLGKEAVLADSGRAGEVAARAGRVRSLTFLSILREYSFPVPYMPIIELLPRQNGWAVLDSPEVLR